jgi:hypothetical protein
MLLTMTIVRAAVVITGLMLASAASGAATIHYTVTDLPDVKPGEDLWQYHYSVSGVSFLSGQGFDIAFAVDDGFQFGDLVDPQSGPSSDFDVMAIQPDPEIPADGLFDAAALVDAPSLTGDFISTFIWRGAGTPGAQTFTLFDTDFSIFETGTTVPEPVVGLLVLPLVAGLGLCRFGRRTQGTTTCDCCESQPSS